MVGIDVSAADQTTFYSQHTEQDPTRRSYAIGDQAMRDVVRMTNEAGTVAVDIETLGLGDKAFTVKVVIIATARHSCVLDGSDPRHRAAAREALGAAEALVFHNAAFDVPPLVAAGIMDIAHIDKVYDTLVYARMALTGERDSRKLGDLEKRYLTGALRTATKDNLTEWGKVNKLTKSQVFEIAQYSDPVYAMYAGWDGILTNMILEPVRADVLRQLTEHPFGRYGADREQAEYLMEREQRHNRVLLKRSARGIRVDPALIDQEQDRLRMQMIGYEEQLAEMGVETATNRNQLAAVIERDGAFPEDYPKTKTGKWSTAKEQIETVDHPAVHTFRAHSDAFKLFGYLETSRLVAKHTGGRVHPQVNVLNARTGRMSYSNPALQQFTPDAMEVFLADEGDAMTSIDWASIEPVTAAHLAGDMSVIAKFEAGEKIYTPIAEYSGLPYKVTKVVVLAMMYGQQLRSLAVSLGVDVATARGWQDRVAAAMPRTQRMMGWASHWSGEIGKTWTLSGRVIDVNPDFGYKGSNYLIQGSAYDILSEATVALDEAGLSEGIYFSRHDELVVSSAIAHDVDAIMRTPPARMIEIIGRVPLLRTDMAELGEHWGDAEHREKLHDSDVGNADLGVSA